MRHSLRWTWAVSAALASAGCGGAADDFPREPISGQVVLDGRPLETGLITFTPAGGGEPVVSGVIKDGGFTLDRGDGPSPGTHRVDVWARKPTGKKVRNPDERGQFIDETREIVPARYNLNSELKAEVKQGSGNS